MSRRKKSSRKNTSKKINANITEFGRRISNSKLINEMGKQTEKIKSDLLSNSHEFLKFRLNQNPQDTRAAILLEKIGPEMNIPDIKRLNNEIRGTLGKKGLKKFKRQKEEKQ